MGASIILVNYEQLEQISALLRGLIDQHQALHRRLELQSEALHGGGWVSEESPAFYAAMEAQLARYKRLIAAWDEAEMRVKELRQTFSDAEEEAAKVAQRIGMMVAQLRPMTDLQRAQLKGFGIVIGENESILTSQAQSVIDFMTQNPDLLAEGMTFAEVVESIGIIDRMEGMNIYLGISPYHPVPWQIEQLRVMDETLDQMGQVAADQFIADYSQAELIKVAYSMGLPPERVNDAALMLLMEGERTIYLDEGVNTPRGDTVAYTGRFDQDGNPYVYQAYPENAPLTASLIRYDPETFEVVEILRRGDPPPIFQQGQIIPPEQRDIVMGNSRNVRYLGLARNNDVYLVNDLFGEGSLTGMYQTTFEDQHLVNHEFNHLILFGASLQALNLLGVSTEGFDVHPRSSNEASEIQADMLVNGFYGLLEGDQQTRFNSFLSQLYIERYNSLEYATVEVPQSYIELIPRN